MIPSYSLSHMSRPKRGHCSASARHRQRGQVKRQAMLDYIASCDYAPSLREIGKAVGLSSSSTVWGHVRTLREEGRLAPNTGKQRCIALTDPGPSEVETLRGRVAELEAVAWRVVDLLRGGQRHIWDRPDPAPEAIRHSLAVLERCLPEVRA